MGPAVRCIGGWSECTGFELVCTPRRSDVRADFAKSVNDDQLVESALGPPNLGKIVSWPFGNLHYARTLSECLEGGCGEAGALATRVISPARTSMVNS